MKPVDCLSEDEENYVHQNSSKRYKSHARSRVVILACALVMALTTGTFRSIGLFLTHLERAFEASNTQVFLLFTWFGAAFSISAMVTHSRLLDNFHERAVVVLGTICGSLGFFVASFLPKMEVVVFVIGVSLGLACQMTASSSLSLTAKYFKKEFILARGIAVSGSAFGLFLLPPLINCLLEEYTFRGASLIMSGILLHAVALAGLMKPVTIRRDKRSGRCVDQKKLPKTGIKNTLLRTVSRKPRQWILCCFRSGDYVSQEVNSASDCEGLKTEHQGDITLANSSDEKSDDMVYGDSIVSYELHSVATGTTDISELTTAHTPCNINTGQNNKTSKCKTGVLRVITGIKTFAFRKSSSWRMTSESVALLDLLQTPHFLLYHLHVFIVYAGSSCILLFYPVFLSDSGFTGDQSAFLMSVAGLSSLFARPVFGFLPEVFASRYRIYLVSQTILVVTIFVAHFGETFFTQVICMVCLGSSYGVPEIYFPLIIREFFRSKHVQRILETNYFTMGIGIACSCVVIGRLRDISGGCITPLYFIGCICCVNFPVLVGMEMLKRSMAGK